MAKPTDFDRSSSDVARNIVEQIFLSEHERLAVLTRLLTSADAANRIAPNAWAVTLFPNLIRLNVGQAEVFVAFDKGFFINCSATAGTPGFDLEACEAVHNRSVPLPQCHYWGTFSDLKQIPPAVEKAHLRFIDLAARAPSGKPRAGTPLMKTHAPGLVEYARAVVDLR